MKKKLGLVVAVMLVAAMVLSITAHGLESPQAAISGGGGGTTISITDITPRDVVSGDEVKSEDNSKEDNTEKEKNHEAKSYTVSSYCPVSVQTSEEGGVRLLVKTFLVPQGTNAQALVEEDLTRLGVAYKVTDILRRELAGDAEQKAVSQTVTLDAETDKLDDILPLLKSTMEYQEDGFSGTLNLDKNSIKTAEAGTSNYSYQMKETREFANLDRNDLAYIPKTAEKNGVTLNLADVEWIPMASGADNSAVPSLFSALATYTGTAWGSKADGYTVTADYIGEVSKETEGRVMYSIVYEEVLPLANNDFPWKTVGLAVLGVVIVAAAGTGVFFLVSFLRNREAKPKGRKIPQNPYADRPKMHRPEMLRAMDRGSGGE